MRLCSVVVLLLFVGIICVALNDFTFYNASLQKKTAQTFKEYYAKVFISQSFKNTCEGKGFENFEEWQKACYALYKIDSMEWSESDDFVYGRWTGSAEIERCSGEVYVKK